MKVCSVIVTYGDRFHLLKQVIEACYKEGVDKVIVIDNASEENSKKKLQKLDKNEDRLKVIYLDENTGSAGGYKRGLQEAYKCEECEYILTLDDDNIISQNSLKSIKNLFNYLNRYKDNIMLAMYRPIWNDNEISIYYGDIKTQNIQINNFMAFNFTNYIKHIFSKIIKPKKNKLLHPLQPIMYNEMGGLIFSKKILNQVGYPFEPFYLYTDDIEFTYRFTKSGGKIFICSEITIDDIDMTYSDGEKQISYFDKEFSEFKMYYLLRNRAYFSKKFKSNNLLFYGNGLFLSLLFFKNIFKTSPNLFFRRYKLFLKAVHDGLNNNMGQRY